MLHYPVYKKLIRNFCTLNLEVPAVSNILTGIILPKDREDDFLEATAIDESDLATLDWGTPQRIRVPELTIKERGFI